MNTTHFDMYLAI